MREKIKYLLRYDSNSKREMKMKNNSINEMSIFRLAFHDCLPYKDGKAVCDGCLDWHNMGMQQRGKQQLSLGRGCVYHGVIIHEFMHAIGKKIVLSMHKVIS